MELIPEDSQKRLDCLLLIQARLHGWSGSNTDRAKRLELSTQTVTSLMNGIPKDSVWGKIESLTLKGSELSYIESVSTNVVSRSVSPVIVASVSPH